MNPTDPALEPLLTRVVETAVAKAMGTSVPYSHAALVVGPLTASTVALFFFWKGERDGRLADMKDRLEEQKAVAVALDRSTEALRAARGS